MNDEYKVMKQGEKTYFTTTDAAAVTNVPDNFVQSVLKTISTVEPYMYQFNSSEPEFPVIIDYDDFTVHMNFPDFYLVEHDHGDHSTPEFYEPLSKKKEALEQLRMIATLISIDQKYQKKKPEEIEPTISDVQPPTSDVEEDSNDDVNDDVVEA